jgi:hypothetical protein
MVSMEEIRSRPHGVKRVGLGEIGLFTGGMVGSMVYHSCESRGGQQRCS